MKNLLIIILALAIFGGCKKTEKQTDESNSKITVQMSQSGNVLFRVLDNSNQPVANSKLILRSQYYSNSSSTYSYTYTLLYDSTTVNGEYDFGKLLQGTYNIYTGIKKNNFTYTDNIDFQIIAENSKTVQLFPFKNVGKISIKIVNQSTSSPYSNLKVALLGSGNYSSSSDFETLLSKALITQTTNSEGIVLFTDIPGGSSYNILAYYDSQHYATYYNSVSASKNTTQTYTISVSIP